MATGTIFVNNLPPVPKKYENDTEVWRFLNSIRDRIGGASGALIYDTVNAAQSVSSIEGQLLATRAELHDEVSNVLAVVSEALQNNKDEVETLILDAKAESQQNIEFLTNEVLLQNVVPGDDPLFEDYSAAAIQQVLDTVSLDFVLGVGNISTKEAFIGGLTIYNPTASILNFRETLTLPTYNFDFGLSIAGTPEIGLYDRAASVWKFLFETDGTNFNRFRIKTNTAIETVLNPYLTLKQTGGQEWRLKNDSTNTRFGIYDQTIGAYRCWWDNSTGEMFVPQEMNAQSQLLVNSPIDTGEQLIVNGTTKSTYFTGDGYNLTNLNASALLSGVVDPGLLAEVYAYNLVGGAAISTSHNGYGTWTIDNTGVTSCIAGSDIIVSSATGDVVITNSAPSDYRLKENICDLTDIDRFDALRPVRYNFKNAPSETRDGFIAHEVQLVVPEAVTGQKDGPEIQTLSVQRLIPLLTAKIKHQQKQIDDLKTKVSMLLKLQGIED